MNDTKYDGPKKLEPVEIRQDNSTGGHETLDIMSHDDIIAGLEKQLAEARVEVEQTKRMIETVNKNNRLLSLSKET